MQQVAVLLEKHGDTLSKRVARLELALTEAKRATLESNFDDGTKQLVAAAIAATHAEALESVRP